MKIKEYTRFIKEQFNEIALLNNMEWTSESDYLIELENKKSKIIFFTERGDINYNLGITLTNKTKNEFYYNFPEVKGFENFEQGLSEEQLLLVDEQSDELKKIIFTYKSFLSSHCQDMLSGDFSNVDKGNPN